LGSVANEPRRPLRQPWPGGSGQVKGGASPPPACVGHAVLSLPLLHKTTHRQRAVALYSGFVDEREAKNSFMADELPQSQAMAYYDADGYPERVTTDHQPAAKDSRQRPCAASLSIVRSSSMYAPMNQCGLTLVKNSRYCRRRGGLRMLSANPRQEVQHWLHSRSRWTA